MPTVRAEKTKRKVKRAMKKITIPAEAREVAAELLRDAEIKVETTPTGRVPGLTIGATKTTYNYQDLVRMFPIVSFIPEETIPLTFQGVKVQAYVGIEMHVPKCFKDIYDNHRKEKRQIQKTLKEAGILDLGVGGLPPEVTA